MARDRKQLHPKKLEILESKLYQVFFPVITRRTTRSQVIDWPIIFDETLAELVGMLIHNGKVSRGLDSIQVRNTSKFFQFEERLAELLDKLNLRLNTNCRNWKGLFQQQSPQINSGEFVKTLLSILECERIEQHMGLEQIPAIIKQSPLSVQKAFLVGYLSTCPSKVTCVDQHHQINFIPFMQPFVKELVTMLKSFDVECVDHGAFFTTDLGVHHDRWKIEIERK